MQYSNLLFVWAISITCCTGFLIAVSFYLYIRRGRRSATIGTSRVRVTDFFFITVLAVLLGLYILSINRASSLVFAVGNIAVEGLLVFYAVRNRTTT